MLSASLKEDREVGEEGAFSAVSSEEFEYEIGGDCGEPTIKAAFSSIMLDIFDCVDEALLKTIFGLVNRSGEAEQSAKESGCVELIELLEGGAFSCFHCLDEVSFTFEVV